MDEGFGYALQVPGAGFAVASSGEYRPLWTSAGSIAIMNAFSFSPACPPSCPNTSRVTSDAYDHQLITSVRTPASRPTSAATDESTAVWPPPWPLIRMMFLNLFFARPRRTALTYGR